MTSASAPEVSLARQRQEELKEQWLEQRLAERNTNRAAVATSPEGNDVLSVEWLTQRNLAAASARERQEELMIEHGMIGPTKVNTQQRIIAHAVMTPSGPVIDDYAVLPSDAPEQIAPTQCDDEYSTGLRQ